MWSCLNERWWSKSKPGLAHLMGLLAFIFFAAPAISTQAQELDVRARYVLSVSGNIIADINIDLNSAGTAYSIDLSARVSGLGQFIASGSASASVRGKHAPDRYQGEHFTLNTRTSDANVTVNVAYQNASVTAFTVVPPLEPSFDRVPIERSQLRNVNDGLSAFILKNDALDGSLCDRKLQVFTGFERFNLNLTYAGEEMATSTRTGYQGPVVLCHISYTPVSGHNESSDITNYLKASDRMLIWYAPVGQTGTFIPYRLLIGTAMGDLSMVLTQLDGNF